MGGFTACSFLTGQVSNPTAIQGIRFLDGSYGGHSGRIEIKFTGVWGTICDGAWDHGASTVACRYLYM